MIHYFLHASLLLGLTYVIYRFLLRRETFFAVNRFALLAMLLLSVLLPLITIPQEWSLRNESPNLVELIVPTQPSMDRVEDVQQTHQASPKHAQETAPYIFKDGAQWARLASGIYVGGVLVFLSSFLVQLVLLLWKSSRLESIRDGRYRIYELQKESPPFSFFRNIYVNPSLYEYDIYAQILAHEKFHVDQRHYLDKLGVEFLLMLFWFNPFVWGIRNLMSHNMEYQVDDAMLDTGIDKASYQMSLLQVSAKIHPLSFTNNYNQTLLEKRIEMMNGKKSSPRSSWKYLLILPVFALTLFSFNPTSNGNVDALSPGVSLIGNHDHTETIEIEGAFKDPNTQNTFVLANITGKVTILGHDLETVQVSAIKSIKAPNEAQKNQGVAEIKVGKRARDDYFAIYLDSPYSQFNAEEDTFSYSENCDGAPCFSYTFRLDYTIRLPRNTNLIVQNVNGGDVRMASIAAQHIKVKHITGSIDLEGVSGNAELETVSGDIQASFTKVPTGASAFKTISGDLSISYPQTFSGKVQQKAGDGSFSTDFTVEPRFLKNEKPMRSFAIGQSEATFQLETTSGDIELKSNGL